MTVALRTLLDGFLAAGLGSYLDDGPGWQVESAGEALIWSASSPPHAEGNRVQWSVTHTSGLQASVVLTGDSAYGAATLQVTLTTTSDHLSAPISAHLVRMQRTET